MTLRWLWLETTDRCNSRCSTCNIWRKTPTPQSELLTHERLEEVLYSWLFRKVEIILNSGGECSLIDLEDLLKREHAALPNALLQVSTNGLLPTKIVSSILPVLKDGARVDVGISIDGVGLDHDLVRGVKVNFEKVDWLLTKLCRLRKQYPKLSICSGSTLTAVTCGRQKDILDYLVPFHVPFGWHWFNQSAFYENECGMFKSVSGFQKAILQVFPEGPYRDMWIKSLETSIIPRFKCHALDSFCVLKCNGDVVPCLSLWNLSIGNVKNADPLALWNSERAKDVRSKVAQCSGCLNTWGVNWSLITERYPLLWWRLKRKIKIACKL